MHNGRRPFGVLNSVLVQNLLRFCLIKRTKKHIPYGKKCTAANSFREQLENTLGLFGKHNLIWLTSFRGMFPRCSLFTCKLGLLRIFSEYVANMIQGSKL